MKLKRITSLMLSAVMLLSLAACTTKDKDNSSSSSQSQEENTPFPVTIGEVTLKTQPKSVVSLAPGITDKILDLGMEGQLKGVSDYCNVLGDYTTCGSSLEPNLEALKQVKPDLLFTETPLSADMIDAIYQLNCEIIVLPRAKTLKGMMENYTTVATALTGDPAYVDEANLAGLTKVSDRLAQLQASSEKINAQLSGEKAKAIYLQALDYTVATGDTFEQELFPLLGLVNIAEPYGDWAFPEAKDADYDPDVIFYDKEIKVESIKASKALKSTKAVKNNKLFPITISDFERQNVSMMNQIEELMEKLYPDVISGSASAETSSSQSSSGSGSK